ncbi:hypothetical protein [Shewanella sp. UCD-KL12]|nr:hypothetical protein [Shewanella sp. UCD-KL12]
MNVSGTAYSNKDKVVTPTHREKNAVSNKDFGTVMFTVGYRF